jgi:hypothetical protein
MKKHVLELRPTQFAVGMKEVERKVKKLKAMSAKELEEYLDSHKVPIVVCPDQQAHVIDHHHLVRACWEAGIEKVMTVVHENLEHVKGSEFWKTMTHKNWSHLFDQFGQGPHPANRLPLDVRGMADDPYRSLAWAVREAGGYEKNTEPFSEFKWADFFRKHVEIPRSAEGFERAVSQAMELCAQSEAKHLPGYKGKR